MLGHRRSLPSDLLGFPQQFAGTHLYSWEKRGTVKVKCLAQEHNTMSPARARTRTARSRDQRTNHEANILTILSYLKIRSQTTSWSSFQTRSQILRRESRRRRRAECRGGTPSFLVRTDTTTLLFIDFRIL